jgi:hypothetical protein
MVFDTCLFFTRPVDVEVVPGNCETSAYIIGCFDLQNLLEADGFVQDILTWI